MALQNTGSFQYLIYKIYRNRILRFSAYTLAIFTEYTVWAAFGGRKLEVT